MPEEWTPEQTRDAIADDWGDAAAQNIALINRWLERGDIAAIYENAEIGHPLAGQLKITSYGSDQAQLERSQFPEGPPQTLPDIGNTINYRYQLKAVCSSGPVPLPA